VNPGQARTTELREVFRFAGIHRQQQLVAEAGPRVTAHQIERIAEERWAISHQRVELDRDSGLEKGLVV